MADEYEFERKYLGVVIYENDFKYFVPLASPKDNDYFIDSDGNKKIRKSIVPIMRITYIEKDGNMTLLGKLKFSSMIPVMDSEIHKYDIMSESNEKYKGLVLKEWEFIRSNKDKIIKNANIIRTQKINKVDGINYLNNTVDFVLLEQKAKDYISPIRAIDEAATTKETADS